MVLLALWAQDSLAQESPQTGVRAELDVGIILRTGNASTRSAHLAFAAAKSVGRHLLRLQLSAAHARNSFFTSVDADDSGDIDASEHRQSEVTSTQEWLAEAEYEYRLSPMHRLFVGSEAGARRIAGERYRLANSLGYKLALLDGKRHQLQFSVGYQYRYENLLSEKRNRLIHGALARLWLKSRLSSDTQLTMGLSALSNINRVQSSRGPIELADDSLIDSELSLQTRIATSWYFRFRLAAHYDLNPPARPAGSVPFSAGFRPDGVSLTTQALVSLVWAVL